MDNSQNTQNNPYNNPHNNQNNNHYNINNNSNNNNTKNYLYLDELHPVEVFKILAASTKTHKGKFLDQIKIIIPENIIYGTLATLVIPDPYIHEKSQSREHSAVFEEAINAYRSLKSRDPGPVDHNEPLSLLEGLSRLLLSPMPTDYQKTTLLKSDEYLAVNRNIKNQEAVSLFQKLSLNATHTRAAAAETRDGNRWLFHLKDDHNRRSSFLSLAAGETLPGSQILRGYRSNEDLIFLPSNVAEELMPGSLELDHFCRFIRSAPHLFGRNDDEIPKGLLAAIVQWPRKVTKEKADEKETRQFDLEFIFLPGLKFYSQSTFIKPAPGYTAFEYLDLKETQVSLDRLKSVLQTSAPNVGYRLELRPTRHIETTKADQLYEKKARVEYQIAYLQSISRPRPVLYRFSQKQLPALADVIRNFPVKVLHDGGLKYGFQTTTYEPTGFHFILVEPGDAAMSGLDPMPLWEDLDVQPMCFHLDPSWARYYYERGSALVFVPAGCALSPVMHDWDRNSMDRYLSETMQQWFENAPQPSELPEQPIYIFDGIARPGAAIRISVLNRQKFKPLHTRLGWLNDNLTVLHHIGIENLISSMAKDISWQKLYRQLLDDAHNIQREFEAAVVGSSRQTAEIIHEMTETLTDEINRSIEKTFQMVQYIKELDQRIQQWQNICSGMKGVLDEVNTKQDKVIEQSVKANNEFYTLVKQIDYEITNAQMSRNEIENKVADEIERLKASYKNLKKKLLTLK